METLTMWQPQGFHGLFIYLFVALGTLHFPEQLSIVTIFIIGKL